MTKSVSDSIYQAIAAIRLIDPHTHINPHAPASSTLADLLGYHYYTELAHSAGMPKDQIEEDDLPPRELVRRLVSNLSPIENTAQYRWLVEICRMFFDFDGDRIDSSNWEAVYDSAEKQMQTAEWSQQVLDQSNVEAVFLTNDFDDPLEGFDTDTYIPCLRTDDLVFHLGKPETRRRLGDCSSIGLDGSLTSLRQSLEQRFEHFVAAGARACAISLPPTFEPIPVSDGRAETALGEVLRKGAGADPSHQAALSRRVFWTLAELCDHYGLPFDLMIGVNRGVYADGVYQGQDLYDSRVSLIQYRELFNAFPDVKFPISVLASVTNQELVSYAWIFPNVITNGHWWYSNTPSFITRDASARLEAVPRTKQIAYYSDAYKLEFVWPKFDMYRRVLANILAEHFVTACGWSEERAIELGRQVLRDNVDEIFPRPQPRDRPRGGDSPEATWDDSDAAQTARFSAQETTTEDSWVDAAAGVSSALAAEAIGTVEVGEDDQSGDALETHELADFPTKISDTVRMDEAEPSTADSEELALLDPLPSAEEIEAVDLDDVELRDTSVNRAELTDELDAEPLDVGDLTAEDEIVDEAPPDIRMLRSESSFEPNEDSLRLRPDPMTGEWTFPSPAEEETDDEDKPGERS